MGSTRCLVCGRPLKILKSVEREIGPRCWARLMKEAEAKEAESNG